MTHSMTPELFLTERLGIRPLNANEMFSLKNTCFKITRQGLIHPNIDRSGPLMLRSFVSPPKSDPHLEGKMVIGIDVGGINLRMGVGKIYNEKIEPTVDISSKEIKIKYDSLDEFFQMLLDSGLQKILEENPDAPLACIFSFPGSGEKTDGGIDMIIGKDLTKEWKIGGSAGKKLGKELNKFLEKRGIGKRKYFIDNDTVALIKDDQTDMGIVCASGYNLSAVVENSILGESPDEDGKTIINGEFGSSNTAREIPVISKKLREKIALEERKDYYGIPQRDEYQVSGKYLGNSLGLIIDELKNNFNLFSSVHNADFKKSFVVSEILENNWEKVKERFVTNVNFNDQEKKILIQVASVLRDRSAQIVAGHLVALNQAISPKRKNISISSDGPIIQEMPGWKKRFLKEINILTEGELNVKINETKYQGKGHNFRGIFDVMYQAVEYFARENK